MDNPSTPSPLKLPRAIEADPRREAMEKLLLAGSHLLWEGGKYSASRVTFTPALEKALKTAFGYKKAERGLERIETVLDSEKKGLVALSKKQGTPLAQRVSRLLVIANDGSERFNRACESMLHEHADRLFCLQVDVPSDRLGMNLFGPGSETKAILVSDRDTVTNVLWSLLES